MKINSNIFRAYDIRGIYPSELNENTAYLIGRAFVGFLKKRKLKIVVGRDNRLSSPTLHKNLVKGITDMGADVVDIGLTATPMFYFAVAHYNYDGGVIVTASHNPGQYNGFKMVREKAIPISGESGIKDIQRLFRNKPQPVKSRGKVLKKEVIKNYVSFNLNGIDKNNLKPLSIVVDTANAVSGLVIPEIFKNLPCKINHLFKKSDGSFPNHPPDPLLKENLKALQAEVKKKKADMGVAFDGDGDRIIFIAETGEIISGDLITAFLADLVIRKYPGAKILYDVRSSNIVKETIQNAGGAPVIYRIGHSFIKEKMRNEKIVFAGEFSGHYYHKDYYFCDAPLFALFKFLEEVSKKPASQIIKPYQKYYHSGEVNLKIEDKEEALKRLKKQYSDGLFLEIDGLRVDYKDWWFLVRASNTEPLLRLVVEARTKSLMEEKKKELIALIKK